MRKLAILMVFLTAVARAEETYVVQSAVLAKTKEVPASSVSELAVAKAALRDGLWDVARLHAAKADGVEAKYVIVESFAREGKWRELLETCEAWKNPDDDVFVYFRSLALFETGAASKAEYLISDRKFSDPVYAGLTARLRARLAMTAGGAAEALKIVDASPEDFADEESRMFAAGLYAATGDRPGAEKIWRSVVASGEASGERAFAIASANLGDVEAMRAAYARSKSAENRRLVGFALGKALLRGGKTMDEGVALIRTLVRESPDAEGARDGLSAIADALLADGRHKAAAEVYREVFETWPDSIKSMALNDGYGWALSKLGKYDEAIEAFARAESEALSDGDKAVEIVKQGDVLAAAGREDESLMKYRLVMEKYPETAPAGRIKELVRLRELEDRGRENYRAYRFKEAQDCFRAVGKEDAARRPRMEYYEVLCLYGQGLDDEAEELASSLAAESSDAKVKAEATLWLAKHSYNRGLWETARKLFSDYAEAAPKSPEAPEALVWSARAAFAANDFQQAIQIVTRLAERYPESPFRSRGFLVQGESLIELARFDEAVLVLERAAAVDGTGDGDRLRASLLRADALFAMGADNPARYEEALEAYRVVRMGESLDSSRRLTVSYKIAKTLEKLKRLPEAVDRYYTDVVLAYRDGREKGISFDGDARTAFSRAAFRLADEFESRGKDFQAVHVLELVSSSDVPAAAEAAKRIDRIQRKGNFL